MNASTNPDAGGPNTLPWSSFFSLSLKLISYATGHGENIRNCFKLLATGRGFTQHPGQQFHD